MARSRKKLGEILVGWGVVTKDQVKQAGSAAKSAGKRLGEVMVEQGFATEGQITKALANQFGMEYVDLAANGMSDKIDMKLIPEDLIRKYLILPLNKSGSKLQLVIHDPMDLELMDMLRFRLNAEVEPRLSSRTDIKAFIDGTLEAKRPSIAEIEPGESLVTDSIDRTIDRSVDRSVDRSIDVASEDSPIVKLTNRMLTEAVRMRASDIHIEPMSDRVRLRYRIDGVCIERDNLPKRMQNALLSRIKLMSGMNIAEKRVPQDGRIKLGVDDIFIDFRVSACPA